MLREDDEERVGEVLYPSDFADFKLCAEVMLRGTCHPPGGLPVTECPVRVSLGTWSKSLHVVGPRVWVDGAFGDIASDPLPFTRMPLSYASAFGAPVTRRTRSVRASTAGSCPRWSTPASACRSRRDRPAPRASAPINPAWPPRAGKLGVAYGKSYREARAPFYAEDLDWSYSGAAPPDQQLEGYLRGDEEITFQNLHPGAPLFSKRLARRSASAPS